MRRYGSVGFAFVRPKRINVPDVVGYRGKFAAICPSTNTVVEHDFNMMAPPGITIHTGRF